jgi:hypothetical protein
MPKLARTYYTLVRHSAHYKGDPRFAAAVETQSVTTTEALAVVGRAGGPLYFSITQAESGEALENYPPPDTEGIIPRARGTFSETAAIDGLHIYLPAQ